MKNQALFSSQDKSKELKCRLLQFLVGALRVKAAGLTAANFHMQPPEFGGKKVSLNSSVI